MKRVIGWGVIGGTVVQEISALFSNMRIGFFEKVGDHISDKVKTPLRAIKDWFTGAKYESTMNATPGSAIYTILDSQGDAGHIRLPEGYSLNPVGGDNVEILNPNGESISGPIMIDVNPDQTLSQQTIDALERAGNAHVSGAQMEDLTPAGAGAYPNPESGIAGERTIKIVDHWDNNTRAYDGSELKLTYGGQGGTGIEYGPNGQPTAYVMSVKGMMNMTTTGAGSEMDLGDLIKNGHAKFMIYNSDIQHVHGDVSGIVVDVDPATGNIRMPVDSPASKMFFIENGKAHWHGQILALEERPDGSFSTIARQFGDGVLPEPAPVVPEMIPVHDINISVNEDMPAEAPLFLPGIFGRETINSTKDREVAPDPIIRQPLERAFPPHEPLSDIDRQTYMHVREYRNESELCEYLYICAKYSLPLSQQDKRTIAQHKALVVQKGITMYGPEADRVFAYVGISPSEVQSYKRIIETNRQRSTERTGSYDPNDKSNLRQSKTQSIPESTNSKLKAEKLRQSYNTPELRQQSPKRRGPFGWLGDFFSSLFGR